MRAAAQCGGIPVKFSEWPFHFGAGREKAIGSKELGEAVLPYSSHVIDCFGPHRCMFASNFPVDRLVGKFETIYKGFFEITKNFSKSDRSKLFHDNALKIYKIS